MRTLLLFVYNIISFVFHKLCSRRKWLVHPLQRISPKARIKRFNNATLIIERNCEIEAGADLQVHGNGKLKIGKGTYMNRYCMISAQESISIGSHCMFGPSVKIFDNNHRFTREFGVESRLITAPISIGNNCWLASNVIVLKGAMIGDNCIIGAGCIISDVVPSGSIVKAKRVNTVERIAE